MLEGSDQEMTARSRSAWIGLFVLIVFVALSGWLYVRQGQGPLELGRNGERYVVVYYANETTEEAPDSTPYRTLLAILASSKRAVGTDLAAALTQDARDFPNSVRYKVAAFLEQARRRNFDLAIFTNELALGHQYSFFDSRLQNLQKSDFEPPSAPAHPFLRLAPLSQPAALRQALVDVIRRYPPAPLRILLIVHSHGTLDMALMPRVSTDVDHATSQEITAALDESGEAPPPSWAQPQGTTKTEFWRVLRDVSTVFGNVSFPLVVRASCESGLGSLQEYLAIPDKVGLVAHNATRLMDTRSQQLDLILGNADGNLSLSDLVPAIRRAGFDFDTKASLAAWLVPLTLWHIPAIVFFSPMIGLLIGGVVRVGARRIPNRLIYTWRGPYR